MVEVTLKVLAREKLRIYRKGDKLSLYFSTSPVAYKKKVKVRQVLSTLSQIEKHCRGNSWSLFLLGHLFFSPWGGGI